jgi:hypothetical protein
MGKLEKAMAQVFETQPNEFQDLWAESRRLPVNCRVLESYALRALSSLARRWSKIGMQDIADDDGLNEDYNDTWCDSEWRYAKAEEYARKALEVAEIHGNAVDVAFAQRDLRSAVVCTRIKPWS